MGTARHGKPTWTGLGTLPRRRRGGPDACHTCFRDIVPCVQTSVITHPARHQQLGIHWLVEYLLHLLLTTQSSLPLQQGPKVSVEHKHSGMIRIPCCAGMHDGPRQMGRTPMGRTPMGPAPVQREVPPRLMRHQVEPVCHVSVEHVMYIPSDFTSHPRLQSHGPGSDGYWTPMLFRTWIFLVLLPLRTPSIGATTCALATW